MRQPSRLSRFFKWSGLSLTVLIAALWMASIVTGWNYGLFYQNVFFPRVSLYDGCVALTDVALKAGFDGRWGWRIDPISHLPGERFWFFQGGSPYWLVISLWIPFLVVAVPTAFLWWRDRPFAAGRCPTCGYDLRGNASGACPECGTTIQAGTTSGESREGNPT